MNYRDSIARMLRLGERRLVVNLDDLRDYKADLCRGYVSSCVVENCSGVTLGYGGS